MLIALPNQVSFWSFRARSDPELTRKLPQDKSFTLTLFAHQSTFDTLDAQLAKGGDSNPVVDLFRTEFPDALALMGEDELLKSWRENPKDGLITVEVRASGAKAAKSLKLTLPSLSARLTITRTRRY